jgi:glutathione synthase/RimK-type ligase-like ATP-grasp enzyme
MKNIFLRRQGLGLESIRNIMEKMETPSRIHRIDLRNTLPEHTSSINWGNTDVSPQVYNRMINQREGIVEVSNKSKFRVKLYENNLTMFSTNTLGNARVALSEGKKLLVRPMNHFGGRNIYLVTNENELENAIRACGYGWYASEYIKKEKEYRVFVAQGRVVYMVEKIVEDRTAIAWNVHQGGRFENIRFDSWNLRVAKASIESFNLTQLDFGAVDVIVDSNGTPFVLEINTAPSLNSPYWIECVAKTFDYLINSFDETTQSYPRIPLIAERGGYRKFIHPSMSNEAQIPNQVNTPPRPVEPPRPIILTETYTFRPQISFNFEFELNNNVQREEIINRKREEIRAYLRAGGYVE